MSPHGTSRTYAGHKTNSAHRAKADLDGRKLRLSNAAPVGSLTSVQRSGRLGRPLVEVKDPHIETALEQILYAMTPQESEPRERPRPLSWAQSCGGAVQSSGRVHPFPHSDLSAQCTRASGNQPQSSMPTGSIGPGRAPVGVPMFSKCGVGKPRL